MNVNWYNHFGNVCHDMTSKVNLHRAFDPAMLLLGVSARAVAFNLGLFYITNWTVTYKHRVLWNNINIPSIHITHSGKFYSLLIMTHQSDVTIYYGITVHSVNTAALKNLWPKGPRKQKHLQKYCHNRKKTKLQIYRQNKSLAA